MRIECNNGFYIHDWKDINDILSQCKVCMIINKTEDRNEFKE